MEKLNIKVCMAGINIMVKTFLCVLDIKKVVNRVLRGFKKIIIKITDSPREALTC